MLSENEIGTLILLCWIFVATEQLQNPSAERTQQENQEVLQTLQVEDFRLNPNFTSSEILSLLTSH